MRYITPICVFAAPSALGEAAAREVSLIPGQQVRVATMTQPKKVYQLQRLNAALGVLASPTTRFLFLTGYGA
jgi:hypothetical protein